jgi:hypothetical protein
MNLLLRAALLEPPEAIRAFKHWKSQTDFETLEKEFLLLPSVFKNLEGALSTDPLEPRLRGIYKQTWLRQQRLGHLQHQLLECLSALGVNARPLDDPGTDLLASADLQVNADAPSLQRALPAEWKSSFDARQWRHQHHVQLEHANPREPLRLRLFDTTINRSCQRWLHRIEYGSLDALWLLRFVPHADELTAVLEAAPARGLTRRLEAALALGVASGVLEASFARSAPVHPRLEAAQYGRVHARTRLSRFWAACQRERLLGDSRSNLELLMQPLLRRRFSFIGRRN